MSDFALWNEIGKIYMKMGAYDDAIAAYRRAIELAPQWGWSYAYLAMACCQKGDFAAAVLLYQKAIALVQDDSEKATLWNHLGDAYRRLHDYDRAMQAYRQADELGAAAPAANALAPDLNHLRAALERTPTPPPTVPPPESAPAAPRRAQPPRPTGEQPASPASVPAAPAVSVASRPVNEARSLEVATLPPAPAVSPTVEPRPAPPKATATAFIAAAARAGNQSTTAAAVETLSPVPQPAEAPTGGEAAPKADTLEKKASLYKRITDINPANDRAWDTLGLSLKALGRYEEAAAAFRQAIALCPDREVYHYHLGLVYAAQKKHQEAVEAFRKVVELNPNYVLAHGALAGSYRRLGMHAEAERHIQIASPQMQLENEYNRACFEAICGNHDQAILLLKQALEKKQTTLEWMRCDPDLDSLRADPRFVALMQARE
jgi:tetratricopeptide (TPR) repeat protein